MNDPSQFPLETSHGIRPHSGLGERVLVGLALVALLAGVMVGVGNVLNHDAETAAASGQASPSVTSRETPSERPLQTLRVEPGTLPEPQVSNDAFNGWIRANADLVIHEAPSAESPAMGTLAEGALAYGDQDAGFAGPDWLRLSSPESGWVEASPGLVMRYQPPTVQNSGYVYGLAAGIDGFVALGTPPGPSDRYVPPSPLVSADGGRWSTVSSVAFPEAYLDSVTWGPAGWLAAGTTSTFDENQVWIWSSSDGRQWRLLGQLVAQGIDHVSQIAGSDGGYLLETEGRGGFGPGSGNLWFSTDGLTWHEAANPSAGRQDGWRRIVGVPSGFFTWTGGYDTIGYPQPSAKTGAFSADGQAWAPVAQGPLSQAMTLTADSRGLLAIDVDTATGTPQVWRGALDAARLVWRREPGTDRVFAGSVVTALVSDGQRRYAFGWGRSTERPVMWTDAGAGWTRSPLPDSFGGFPREAVAGPRGVVLLGTRHTLRGDNPVFWHRTASGEWLPEQQPVFDLVPDPTTEACPALPRDLPEFLVLDRATALVCFGDSPITMRAWSVGCDQCYGYGPGVSEPAWLMAPTDNQLYLSPIQPADYSSDWSTNAVLAPSVAVEPGWSKGAWIELTGHFDDPAAGTCHYAPSPQEWAYMSDRQSYQDSCRQTFVVTRVTEVSGP
jgi:hypothetical protein